MGYDLDLHVVCRDWMVTDKILPRLAGVLQEQLNVTVSQMPRADAELNYFMVYIDYAERFSDWHMTPTAAYFTHFEDRGKRAFWWSLAAERVDLRIVTAPMYGKQLEKYGATVRVKPPVDREAFTINKTKMRPIITVGVSGQVYQGGRKGEDLVSRLGKSKIAKGFQIVGAGSGWPVPCKWLSVAELPEFYQSLDVYLCTSLIEGNPIGPLEALACGKAVVIPRGVGLLDELPEMPGIYRYEKGNYEEMEDAVKRALGTGANAEDLRAVTEDYTPEEYAAEHEIAFKKLLGKSLAPQVAESSRHGKRGMYCVAYGGPARECATGMIQTFKQHMPGIEVAAASDAKLDGPDHLIEFDNPDIGGRFAKTKIDEFVPNDWQYILYLDADTEVVADISFLYEVLEDGFDMVICTNPGKYHTARKMVRTDNKDECEKTFSKIGTMEIIQLNGGVFAYQRNARTAAFFKAWHEEWQKWGKRDQAALLRALWEHPLKLYVLSNVWNTIVRYVPEPLKYTAGILHYPMTARRWRGIIEGRSDSEEAWKAVKTFKKGK